MCLDRGVPATLVQNGNGIKVKPTGDVVSKLALGLNAALSLTPTRDRWSVQRLPQIVNAMYELRRANGQRRADTKATMTKRVLIVHNRYRSTMPSGENTGVDLIAATLPALGLEVRTYIKSSDEISGMTTRAKALLPMRPIWSPEDHSALKRLIMEFRPDIVQLHNPYPLISPAPLRIAQRHGIPTIHYVHNYRFACMSGNEFRDGNMCTSCNDRHSPLPGVMHHCYRQSRVQSSVMALTLLAHRQTWASVTRWVAISEFVAERLDADGIPKAKIFVCQNFLPDPGVLSGTGEGFLFAARLDEEKGVRVLLDAWVQSGLGMHSSLRIAGDGPLRSLVEEVSRKEQGIKYLGALRGDEYVKAVQQARAVVVPSIWAEPFGRSAAEALAFGRSVVATRMGGLLRSSVVGGWCWAGGVGKWTRCEGWGGGGGGMRSA